MLRSSDSSPKSMAPLALMLGKWQLNPRPCVLAWNCSLGPHSGTGCIYIFIILIFFKKRPPLPTAALPPLAEYEARSVSSKQIPKGCL